MLGPGFTKELHKAAAASQVVPRLVCESPQEWRLGPLTVVLERGSPQAQLRYARLPLARCDAEAAAIMDAWGRALAGLVKKSLAPAALWPRLAESYRALCAAAKQRAGERVALAELREALVAGKRGYTRAQFAFDLARLRHERALVHAGRRLDLGVATGMATSRSGRVVWIEDATGAGQYYQSFRLLEESPPR